MGILVDSTGWLFHSLFPGRIGICKCWFLWREENGSTRRKTLGARTRTNNKLNPHMTPRPGIEPGPHFSHHCAIPAPSIGIFFFRLWSTSDLFRKQTRLNPAKVNVSILPFSRQKTLKSTDFFGPIRPNKGKEYPPFLG